MDAELTRTVRAAMPYAETLGLDFLAASADEVRGRIAWEERLTTAAGLLHGGVLMGFADAVGAYCAFLNLPGGIERDGDDRVEDELLRRGAERDGRGPLAAAPSRQPHVVVETDLFDENGKHVARVTQTQAVL